MYNLLMCYINVINCYISKYIYSKDFGFILHHLYFILNIYKYI